MLIWAAVPILVLSVLASGPFRDSLPAVVENIAQLTAVLSLFVLVCLFEDRGHKRDSSQ